MKKFKVNVTTSGVIILPNGRNVRAPVELNNVNEKELQAYRVQFKARGLSYKIEDVTEDNLEIPELATVSKKVIIEELISQEKDNAEPESFLDKLILDKEK